MSDMNQQIESPAFRVHMLHQPLPEHMQPDNAGSCLPLGLRLLYDPDEGRDKLVFEAVDRDLECDLNALFFHAFRSEDLLAYSGARESDDDMESSPYTEIPVGYGTITDQIRGLSEVMLHINDLARANLRDPDDPEYELPSLAVDTYVNDETPYFIPAENVLKGSNHEYDPYRRRAPR